MRVSDTHALISLHATVTILAPSQVILAQMEVKEVSLTRTEQGSPSADKFRIHCGREGRA